MTENNPIFSWNSIGNVAEGRERLGETMPVFMYRLFEYSVKDILIREFGKEKAIKIFRDAGKKAGYEFAVNVLNLTSPLNNFIAELQKILADKKVGILRIEKLDQETGSAVLTVEEDLDCSGLPPIGETVCNYDEGFLAGVLEAYTHEKYTVKEVDCWASGSRVCRFNAEIEK